MSTELTLLDNKLPLKAYPEKDLDEKLTTVFKYWLSNLLNLKPEKEEALDNAIQIIKKKFWSMGLHEVKQAFEMYALGELPLIPRSNHIDIVLVGQIFNDYKKNQRTKPEPFNESKYKQEQDKLWAISIFEHYESSNKITEDAVWIYDYLESTLKVIKFDEKLKKQIYQQYYKKLPKQRAIEKSKLELLKRTFDQFIKKGTHIKHLLNKPSNK